jgi:hypothetical protein
LAVAFVSFLGCVSVPPHALAPARSYTPHIDKLSVVGFEGSQWVQTGAQVGTIASPPVGLYGYSVGVSGQIVPTNDSAAMRYALENTHCIDVVEEGMGARVRLEGTASAEDNTGLNWVPIIVESVTLLPLVGLPVHDAVRGSATGRLYLDGRPLKSYAVQTDFPYWTTLYSSYGDNARALAIVKGRVLRDLADQVAADLCGPEQGPSAAGSDGPAAR